MGFIEDGGFGDFCFVCKGGGVGLFRWICFLPICCSFCKVPLGRSLFLDIYLFSVPAVLLLNETVLALLA